MSKKKVHYETRPGFRVPIDGQVVGREIEALKRRNGGGITPPLVVEAARPEDSPLHPGITWDPAEAIRKCQESEAGYLMRSYYRVATDDQGIETRTIANVCVRREDDDERSYVTSALILTDDDIRSQVVAEIEGMLRGVINRFRHLPGLRSAVMDAVKLIEFPKEGSEAA